MSKIKIKNFGPIKEGFNDNGNEWMDIKKVTVFIGNQGSGKSTVAKVISTMMWIEKALNRKDFDEFHLTRADLNEYLQYFGIQTYFKEDTIIEYYGKRATITFNRNRFHPDVKLDNSNDYEVPKIMYVPDSRNFLSVIKNATGVKNLPDSLFEFAEEYRKSQADTRGEKVLLPINDVSYRYDLRSDSSFIVGKDYEVNLLNASSGFQSLVPLFLVSSNLARVVKNGSEIGPENISVDQSLKISNEINRIMQDTTLNDIEKYKKSNEIKARFKNKVFINVVEEPEQNLFPTSQQQMLNSLLEFNNMNEGNKLILTTHSPYLINYLTLAVKAEMVKKAVSTEESRKKLKEIVPLEATVRSADLIIYELDETDGKIKKLDNYKGLPSDDNDLNNELDESNELFAQLQEIEKGWR